MGSLFRFILKPFTRLILGLIAIPVFRFILKRVFRQHALDQELGKDLEQWFRGALLLLVATANMEDLLFSWWIQNVDWLDRADWFTMGLRLMLAIGVIEAMPDQDLFAVMYPGPPKLHKGEGIFRQIWRQKVAFLKGFACRHLNRSSPVLAMMCAIVGAQMPSIDDQDKENIARHNFVIGWSYCEQCCAATPLQNLASAEQTQRMMLEIAAMKLKIDQQFERHHERHDQRRLVGWVCYLMAITQYLVIGLVTRRDKALDTLGEFDRAVAERRKELVEGFVEEGNLPKDFDANALISEQPPSEPVSGKPDGGPAP